MLTATATALWGAADNDANSAKTLPGPVKKPTSPSGSTSKASKTLGGVYPTSPIAAAESGSSDD
jgi:hypothetical protein